MVTLIGSWTLLMMRCTAFGDPLSLAIADPLHSADEERFVLIGESIRRRILVVVHTKHEDTIRIGVAQLLLLQGEVHHHADAPARDAARCATYRSRRRKLSAARPKITTTQPTAHTR